MATIGSIAVAFEADIKGLESGIEDVIDLFDDLSEAVDAISEKLSGLSARGVVLKVDTSQITQATKEIETLKSTAEASQPVVTPKADTSGVKAATVAVEDLNTAVEETTATSTTARGSLAQLVVTTARYSSVAVGAATAYKNVRNSVLGYVQAATGAETATDAMVTVQSALRGNTEAIRTVMAAVSNAVLDYTKSLFSVDGAAKAFNATVRLTARAVGVADDALVESIAYLSSFVTRQIAAAGTNTLMNRTLTVVGQAYNTAGTAIEGFLTRSESGTKVGSALASAIDRIAPAVARMNSYFNQAVNATTRFFQTLGRTESISKAVGGAFDALYRSIQSLASGSTGIAAAFAKLVPSAASVAAGISRTAAVSGAAVGVLGSLANAVGLVYGAFKRASSAKAEDGKSAAVVAAEGFADLVARSAAASAAIGAVSGALSAFAAGTSVLGGAVGGAVSGVAGFAATLPLVAPVAIAAAVATGRFHHELEELSVQAQQVDQMADRFGAPRSEIEKLRLSAANTGVSLGQLAKGQQNFFTSLSKIKVGQMNVENVREAKLAFDALDISMSDLKNARPDEVFKMVAEKLSEVEDPAKRTQIAFDLFGKQGAAILPALKEFSELSADFDRLGGSIAQIDFERLLSLENSFDRQKAAAANLGKVLLLPFVELQKAFNNISADISGGLTSALAPIMSLLADMTKPFAVIIEIAGRMINIFLRIAGVVATLFAGFSQAIGIADIFTGIQQGVNAALAPIEQFIGLLQKAANFITQRIGFAQTIFIGIGKAIGFVVGGLAQLVVYVALGAAAWGIYSAAVAVATGFSLAATGQFIMMWIAALGPFALVIGALAAVGAGLAVLTFGIVEAGKWFYSLGEAVGLFGGEAEKIDAATASTEELAAAASTAAEMRASMGIKAAIFGPGEVASAEEITAAVGDAREGLGDLIIRASKFGSAGEEAASAAQKSFNELQQKFADGSITLEEFEKESGKVRERLEENLDILANDSPEVTLKKNLELYKQLGDAAKQSGKEMRDAMADVKIGDKFFPRSEEVKAKAQEFQDKYAAALEAIKKKQQSGGFAAELNDKKKKNEDDLAAGRITREQFEAVKLRLDSTSSQEEAQKAAEDVKRTLERDMGSLDLGFADDIRKRLEDAFKSPVDKFKQELKKVRENMDLSDEEKASAERMLRRDARESLIGKTASEKFDERDRDIKQGKESGLLNANEAMIEAAKNADELAKALGLPVNPSNAMKASTLQLVEAFSKGKISAEEFAKGLAQSRRTFLESLGIKEKPGEADQRQMDELTKRRGKPLSEGGITEDEFQRGRQAIENNIIGQSAGDRIREQRARIEQGMASGAVDKERGQAALRGLDRDKKQAAGLDLSAGEQMQAGIDKINDAFTEAERGSAEYQEAIRKNSDAVKQNIGVEKTAAEQFAESRKKLDKAVKDGVITEQERNRALKRQRDSLLSSLGISKSPAREFEDAVAKINESASELSPDELARGLKEAKDKLMSSLGIEKSPAQNYVDVMSKITEAHKKGVLTFEELTKATKKAGDNLREQLGVQKSPMQEFDDKMKEIAEAVRNGLAPADAEKARVKAREKLAQGLGVDSPQVFAESLKEKLENFNEAFPDVRPPEMSQQQIARDRANRTGVFARRRGESGEEYQGRVRGDLDPTGVEALRNRAEMQRREFRRQQVTMTGVFAVRPGESMQDRQARIRQESERPDRELRSGMLVLDRRQQILRGAPGADPEGPMEKFRMGMEKLEGVRQQIGERQYAANKLNLQAQLQEDLKPALDKLKPDRRAIESSDARSKGGVDTFFRILRGRDNPGMKAQLDTARNTREIAEALKDRDAAPVIAQLQAK